jgi:hypothetical protein
LERRALQALSEFANPRVNNLSTNVFTDYATQTILVTKSKARGRTVESEPLALCHLLNHFRFISDMYKIT